MRPSDAKPWIRAQILYANKEAGLKAFSFFLELERRMASEFDLDQSLQSLDSLVDPTLAEHALREAINTDIILLALDEQDTLSPALRRWLQRLPPVARGGQRALILLDGVPQEYHELAMKRRAWLIGLTDRKGMDFFSYQSPSVDGESMPKTPSRKGHWTVALETETVPCQEFPFANWAWITNVQYVGS